MRCYWQSFKHDASNAILAPDSFANVKRSEIVQTKFESIGQLLGFERQLDANDCGCKVVNSAMVNGRAINRYLSRMVSLGAL